MIHPPARASHRCRRTQGVEFRTAIVGAGTSDLFLDRRHEHRQADTEEHTDRRGGGQADDDKVEQNASRNPTCRREAAGFADWQWCERLLPDVVLKALERTIKGFFASVTPSRSPAAGRGDDSCHRERLPPHLCLHCEESSRRNTPAVAGRRGLPRETG